MEIEKTKNPISSLFSGIVKSNIPTTRGIKYSSPNNTFSKLSSNALKSLGTETTPFGGSTKYESFHPGVDIANEIGTKIPAFSSGKVIEESLGHTKGEKNGGNYVIIQDANGNKHRYSHLNKAYVKVGQYVKAGQTLGEVGNTGNVYSNSGGSGAHLDYRIVSAMGKYINPYSYLKQTT